MPTITVIAQIVAKAHAIDAVKAELLRLVAPTRQEAGCIDYRLHQDSADPAVFVFYENWESRACLERHMKTPHFKQYLDAVEGMIADKVVHLMVEIV